MALTGLIAPDHNRLWRFWRDPKRALRQVFKPTVQLAVRTGAVGLALQALDGTKIQAAGSGPNGRRKEYKEKLLAQLQADGRHHHHPAEPEARRMKVGDTNRFAYNARALADAQEKVIVACAATRPAQAQWQCRSQSIEPRFAQLKEHDGFRRWTVWGLEGVQTQWSLLCATLNLRVLYKKWRSGRGRSAWQKRPGWPSG